MYIGYEWIHSILKIFAHSDLMVHVHKNVIKFLQSLDTLFYARVFKKCFHPIHSENKLFLILSLIMHTQYGRKILEKSGGGNLINEYSNLPMLPVYKMF